MVVSLIIIFLQVLDLKAQEIALCDRVGVSCRGCLPVLQALALCSAPCTLRKDGGDVRDGLANSELLCKPHQSGW